MSIKETLRTDLTEAIRGRNEITSSTIRMVLTAITNEEVAGKDFTKGAYFVNVFDKNFELV